MQFHATTETPHRRKLLCAFNRMLAPEFKPSNSIVVSRWISETIGVSA